MSAYEIAILGSAAPADRATIRATVSAMVADFGLKLGEDVVLHDAASLGERDIHAAFAAVYLGDPTRPDVEAVQRLLAASLPIIPAVSPIGQVATDIPDELKFANAHLQKADDVSFVALSSALLECVGLLRAQRRVFVSYRRIEARAAAVQLHDLLSARGFDVFLDTHDIRPGEPFQEVLWRRLSDADVLVMLDTPTYFESKWTSQELGRARAKEIHVLRIVWPAHVPNRLTDFAESMQIDTDDLVGPDGPLAGEMVDRVVLGVERLRSRSIASRYMSITGRLRAEMTKIDAVIEGVGAHRALALRLANGARMWAYPVVGIPNAELLHDVAEKALRAGQNGKPVLVYDHVGMGDGWNEHLRWLDKNIAAVKAIRVAEAAWAVAGME